jgi:hypothetical protein
MDMSRFRWLQFLWLITNTRSLLASIALAFFQPLYVLAFEFSEAEVTENNGVFKIRVDAVINAPPDYIRAVLTDYLHIYRLSPSIIESEVLPSSIDEETHVRTRLLCCTPVFCREVERVEAVRLLASGDLEAKIVPGLSEFKSGKATWKIMPFEGNSRMVYEASLEPDFFIPPVVGTSIVKNNLKNEFLTTLERVERIASFNARRERDEKHLLAKDSTGTEEKPPCKQQLETSLR